MGLIIIVINSFPTVLPLSINHYYCSSDRKSNDRESNDRESSDRENSDREINLKLR